MSVLNYVMKLDMNMNLITLVIVNAQIILILL